MRKILAGIIVGAALILSSCAAQKELLKTAQTPEEDAYALYGTFVVYEELAAQIVKDPATPANVKDVLRKADATAKPTADAMQDAARTVISIQAQLAAGGTPSEKLEIANARLVSWVGEAKPKITALVCAVNPKQKVCVKE